MYTEIVAVIAAPSQKKDRGQKERDKRGEKEHKKKKKKKKEMRGGSSICMMPVAFVP
jgi:ribosomal protein L12E/L44/L45/RPP1/RPP2